MRITSHKVDDIAPPLKYPELHRRLVDLVLASARSRWIELQHELIECTTRAEQIQAEEARMSDTGRGQSDAGQSAASSTREAPIPCPPTE
jgi:hypothetical protein